LPTPFVRAGRYLALAYGFIGSFLGGVFLGWATERWLHVPPPWGMIAGTLLGVTGGFIHMVRTLEHLERVDSRREP